MIFNFYKDKVDIASNVGKKKYLNFVKTIVNQLEVIDKQHYVNVLAEILDVKEQLIIEYLNSEFKEHTFDDFFNEGNAFIEKGSIKAEKQLLNLMINKEYLTYILNNNVDESLFSIDVHKKIFNTIANFDGKESEILTYLEKKLNTYEEIKVLIYFKENVTNYDNNSIKNQIDDFIKVLRKNIIIKKYESNADENKFIEYLSVFNIISKLEMEQKLFDAVDFIKSLEV